MKPRRIRSPHVHGMQGSFETNHEGRLVRVVTVETKLRLDALDPAHDKAAVADLLLSVKESMGDLYDRVDLKQVADDA